jgi:Ca-activated chloride channel homolog
MNFAYPKVLWLLLVIPPALAFFFWWSLQKRRQLLTRFVAARLLPTLTVGISTRRQKIRLLCLLLAVISLIVALARPRWGFDWEEVRQRGLDIVMAIDTSKSMLAEDIAPNRLARAKLAALDLMQQAKSDRLALVAFAGGAFLQCPMTIDDAAFRQSVESLDVNIIPQGGTALAEAIDIAATAFKEGDNHKILVLFTDGEDQDPNAAKAAEKAAQSGLLIFTIGIGTPEGELLRVKDAKGRTDYLRDEQGNVVKSHLNETLLQQIAGAAGGFYLPLRGAKAIDTLYEKGLARLPKSDAEEKLVKRHRERFHWPLAIGILLLLIEILLPERARASQPRRETTDAKAVLRGTAAVLLLLLPLAATASSSSALRDYNAGKYEQALREYKKLIERKNDPRLQFNAGAAAYRKEQFDEAIKRFNDALLSPDVKLQQQAYYNRGNALYQLGEKTPDPGKRTEAWEKSLQDYKNTLNLNPQDGDAKFNYEFVKKRLEELKQQQPKQQQQQNKNKQDDKQDKDDQKQQEQQQQQDQKQADNDQKKGQQQQDQNQKSEQQKEQEKQQQNEQQQANQSDQQKQQQDQQSKQQEQAKDSAKPGEKKDEENESGPPTQSYAPGQMTPQQAQQLLEAQKGEEKMLPVRPVLKPADRSRPLRDW